MSARPRWQACSKRADAGCTACPDLRLAKGSYAANEQWAEGDECVSECSAGFYNDTTQYAEGRCSHELQICTTRLMVQM